MSKRASLLRAGLSRSLQSQWQPVKQFHDAPSLADCGFNRAPGALFWWPAFFATFFRGPAAAEAPQEPHSVSFQSAPAHRPFQRPPTKRLKALRVLQLKHEHRVAVAEKPVALVDRFGVSGENQFASASFVRGGKGAHEHQQRGAGEMKIRQESVNDFEFVRRMNEDACFAGARHNLKCAGLM